MPFGLEEPTWDVVATEALQPGDRVLLYTDGIVEGRNGVGVEFDLERLTDLLERDLHWPAEEVLRRVVHAVLDWQEGKIRDDATLVLLHWVGPGASTTI